MVAEVLVICPDPVTRDVTRERVIRRRNFWDLVDYRRCNRNVATRRKEKRYRCVDVDVSTFT